MTYSTTIGQLQEHPAIRHRSQDDLYPATEEIDVRALKPPVAHNATPPTEAMSIAAKFLAEQLVSEEMRASAEGLPGEQGYWRAARTALHRGVQAPRSNP